MELSFESILKRAKEEILTDIKTGIVPSIVKSFSELHNYVDANCYGGFCDENYIVSDGFKFENKIQSALDYWIKSEEFKNI